MKDPNVYSLSILHFFLKMKDPNVLKGIETKMSKIEEGRLKFSPFIKKEGIPSILKWCKLSLA
jgi:hypothetical protein